MLGHRIGFGGLPGPTWYKGHTYKQPNNADDTLLSPAAIVDFRRGRYALTPLGVSEIATATAEELNYPAAASMADVLTFSRASAATYADGDGKLLAADVDEPRYELAGGRRMLLREPAATNIIPHSGDFSQPAWVKSDVTLAGTLSAGVLSLHKIMRDGVVSANLSGAIALVSANTYAYSLFVKKSDGGTQRLGVYSDTDLLWRSCVEVAWPSDGVLTAAHVNIVPGNADTVANIAVRGVGNGVYRLSFTSSFGGSSADVLGFRIEANRDADLSCNFAGGVQVEHSQYPGSYVATGAGTATRSADIMRLSPKVEALLKRPETTLVIRYRTIVDPDARDVRRYLICGSDVGLSRYAIRCADTHMLSPQAWVGDGSANSGFSRPSDISGGQDVVVALSVSQNASRYFVNGEASPNNPGGRFDYLSNSATAYYLGSDVAGQNGEQLLLEEMMVYPFEIKPDFMPLLAT